MAVAVVVRVCVAVFENPSAGDIDSQAERGHHQGLIKMDGKRVQQSVDRLAGHERGHGRYHNRAPESAPHHHFARAEAVTSFARVAPGKPVGADRDNKRRDMRAHVAAVGKEGHRVQLPTANNFRHHHHERQDQYAPGAPLRGSGLAAEVMAVFPAGKLHRMHFDAVHFLAPDSWSFATWATRSLYLLTIALRSFTLSLNFFTKSSRWATSSFMASFCFWMPP